MAVISLSGIIGFAGCSKFLDRMPDDQLTLEMVFSDRVRTEDWLAGIYQSVPNPMWGYYMTEGFNIMADDMTIPPQWQQFGWGSSYAYTMGNWNPTFHWQGNYWVELPKRIRAALIFIENVKPNAKQLLTQDEVDLMKNEARFLIAYYYWLMLEVYGTIPFKPGVIESVSTPTGELLIKQSPFDEVVSWIDAELKEVAANLPAAYQDPSKWGRATGVMCLAIRARMLLFAASPLTNGNPDYADFVDKDGVNLFNGTTDPQKWTRAANAYKDLLDLAHADGYKLYYEYNNDGSIDPFMSYYNMTLKRYSEGNREILFGRSNVEVPDKNLQAFQAHNLPTGIGGNGGLGVTQELVDAFFMKNGLPIDHPESGYIEKGFSQEGEVRNTNWKGAEGPDKVQGQVTLPGTYNMYCNREPRFYVSVIYNEAWLGVANRRADFYLRGLDGGPSFDAPQNGYNVRKRVSLDVYPREGRFVYQPGILYRLAEGYLGYAEALNESDPGNPDILRYINLVRERAGIPGLTGGSQAEIREAIIRERQVEFNCEGIRLYDIRRWKLGERRLNNNMSGMNFTGTERSDDESNPAAYFRRTFHVKRTFHKRMYFWPVPQGQIDINPNLVQMKGY